MGNGFVSAVHTGTGIEQEIPLNWFDVYPGQWRLAEDAPELAAPAPTAPADPSVLAPAAEAPAPTPAPEGDAA